MKACLYCLFIVFFLSSCSEKECCVTPPEPTMEGTWKLDKLCFSNGASSCNEEDMWDADTDQFLTFTDSEFTFDIDGEICTGTYVRDGETMVQATFTGGDCTNEERSYILTRLTATEMIFSPLCIEGCPHLYIRQN